MQSQDQIAREYRIAVSGPPAVGKSALTVRFTQLLFVDEYDPTIEDSYKHYATIDDKNVLLDILDTAGQEDYASMKESYMRRGEGFLLVFSVTSLSSFESIQLFYDQIIRVKEDSTFVPIILIGNKTDLEDEREVSELKLKKLARDLKIPYIETSAKLDYNVNELFYTVVKMINKGGIITGDNLGQINGNNNGNNTNNNNSTTNGAYNNGDVKNSTNDQNNVNNVLDASQQNKNSARTQQQHQNQANQTKSNGGGCCVIM